MGSYNVVQILRFYGTTGIMYKVEEIEYLKPIFSALSLYKLYDDRISMPTKTVKELRIVIDEVEIRGSKQAIEWAVFMREYYTWRYNV